MIKGCGVYIRTNPQTGEQYAGKVWGAKEGWDVEKATKKRWRDEDRKNGLAEFTENKIIFSERRSDAPEMSEGMYHIRIAVEEQKAYDSIPSEFRKNKIAPLLQLDRVSSNEEIARIGDRAKKAAGGRNQPREAKVAGGRNQPREAKVAGGRIGGRIGNHIRWHIDRGIKKEGCNMCFPELISS